MTQRLSRVQAAEAVASKWNELGIPFVIGHGLEDYPLALGRDLDILMDPRHAHRALCVARHTLATAGWPTELCPPPLWGHRLIAMASSGDGRPEYLEFHTVAEFTWLALPLVAADVSVTAWTGPFPTNAWTTFAKAIMLPLLGGDTSRFTPTYLESTWRHVTDSREIEAQLHRIIGPHLAAELLAASTSRDAARLVSLQPDIRRRSLLHMVSHPVVSATRVWPFLRKRLGRLFSSSGMRVRLTAPPAVNVREIASRLASEVDHIFVVINTSAPSHRAGRAVQRYRVLSRQGLVLEVAEDPSLRDISLLASGGHGRSRSAASFPIDIGSQQLSMWILRVWADSMRCSVCGDVASDPI